MTEPLDRQRSQLIIWAVGEARRLRLQGNGGDVTCAAPDAKRPERVVHRLPVNGTDDIDGLVVEWQLEQRSGEPRSL